MIHGLEYTIMVELSSFLCIPIGPGVVSMASSPFEDKQVSTRLCC